MTIESEPMCNELCRLQAIRRALSISMQATIMAIAIGEMSILLKIGAKSFRDGIQDICKDTESNLGPFAGF